MQYLLNELTWECNPATWFYGLVYYMARNPQRTHVSPEPLAVYALAADACKLAAAAAAAGVFVPASRRWKCSGRGHEGQGDNFD